MRRILVGALSLSYFSVVGTSALQAPNPPTRITVTGEVRAPGAVASDKPLGLLAAVTQVGGYTAGAAVIEIHRRSSGAGPVTAATPASEYRIQYLLRTDPARTTANDPLLADGDFVIVRRELELHPPAAAGTFGAGAYRLEWTSGWGVAAPVVRTSSEPQYTRAGMILKLQGVVEVEAVVRADGTVGDARILKGLDWRLPDLVAELKRIGGTHSESVLQIVGNGPIGLDASAIECVKTWTFTPGTILGEATPIIQTVSVPFKLR